jgi:cytoskeletal protein CcmA (bactofilin family)
MARTPTSSAGPITGSTIIGPEIRVMGRVTGEEDLHVQGRVDGAISLTETLFVAPGGIVAAEVDALNVVVSGVLVGNVTARESVTLHAGAKLVGDITAPRLIIADGAAFKGNVHMGAAGEDAAAARSAARARPAAPPRRVVAAPARETRAAPPARAATPPRRTPERVAAPARAESRPRAAAPSDDGETTAIVRHVEVPAEDTGRTDGRAAEPEAALARFRGVAATRSPARPAEESAASAKNKLPARARIPKPGKRRVNRR